MTLFRKHALRRSIDTFTNWFFYAGGPGWKGRISIAGAIVLVVIGTSLTILGMLGTEGYRLLISAKEQDARNLVFVELERQGARLGVSIANLGAFAQSSHDALILEADACLEIQDDGMFRLVKGAFPLNGALIDVGLDEPPVQGDTYIVQHNGRDMAARLYVDNGSGARHLVLFGTKTAEWFAETKSILGVPTVYATNRSGQLIFSNDPSITPHNLLERQLVRKFIESPLARGQLEVTAADGAQVFGFFNEIPGTNILVFAELDQKLALSGIHELRDRYIKLAALVFLASGAILYLLLVKLIRPMHRVIDLASQLGAGNFHHNIQVAGVGEVRYLTSAFATLTTNLRIRDEQINALMIERAEKVRLEGELAIAQSIQSNLLPDQALPPESGLSLVSHYSPASEVAGDWFNYYYDPVHRETIIVIADVSGHGAGSCMFTAVLASIFNDQRLRSKTPFSAEQFLNAASENLLILGRNQWHATATVLKITNGLVEITNAGHPPPMIVPVGESSPLALPMGSSALGLETNVILAKRTAPFPPGSTCWLYTDGLVELQSQDEKQFGRKRLKNLVGQLAILPPELALNSLKKSWKDHLGPHAKQQDDICLIGIKAMAQATGADVA